MLWIELSFLFFSRIYNRKNLNIFDVSFITLDLCTAGFQHLFIRTNGDLSLCELFNSSLKNIGNINTLEKVNYDKLIQINKTYLKIKANKYSSCWAIRLCKTCQEDLDKNKKIHNDKKCTYQRESILRFLIEYLEIKRVNLIILDTLK